MRIARATAERRQSPAGARPSDAGTVAAIPLGKDYGRRYGVVIGDDGAVDAGATEALRKEMAGERGDIELFDRGGTIEEIKARALEETHLPPPESPNAS